MIIDASALKGDDFYERFVSSKEPVLVKNLLPNDDLLKAVEENRDSLKNIKGRGSAQYLYLHFNSPIIREHLYCIPLVKTLSERPGIDFRENYRLWDNKKDHLSLFHYDCGSIDILNVCMTGSRSWHFVSPDTPIKCLPFLNVCVPFAPKSHCRSVKFVMKGGDMVYVPRNWFHQVETLEDRTQNVNMVFFDSNDPRLDKRERELAAFRKKIMPSYDYSFSGCPAIEDAIRSTSFLHIIRRFFIELFPVLLMLAVLAAAGFGIWELTAGW